MCNSPLHQKSYQPVITFSKINETKNVFFKTPSKSVIVMTMRCHVKSRNVEM